MPFASIHGQEIFYADSGGDGPAVVFLHGFLFDHTMFDAVVAHLSPDYRCIRVDTRAFGETKYDGEPFTLYDTVEDVVALMDQLSIDKITLVGMSQGGYAAVRFALKHPERLHAVVFVSTYSGVDTEDVKEIYRSMRNTWVNEGPAPLMETYRMLFIGPPDQFVEMQEAWQAKWMARNPQHVAQAMNHLIDRDEIPDEDLQKITLPTLVIHGNADQGMPMALGQSLFAALPNAKGFVEVNGGAHGAIMTHPEQVNAPLKAFLDEYVKGGA